MHPLKQFVANLFPGYFALVMATGALSIASFFLEYYKFAFLLLGINVLAYIWFGALNFWRWLCYPQQVLKDIRDHEVAPSFFTMVASTAIVGSQIKILLQFDHLALGLWLFALCSWLVIMYSFFIAVTIRTNKPQLSDGVNGAWLLASVGTQSLAVLGILVAPTAGSFAAVVVLIAVISYLIACMLYLSIINVIFYRLTFVPLDYKAFTPPYWINMGAVAIATLGGSNLMLNAHHWPLLTTLKPFITGFTLFFWAAASWWIPLLFGLLIWRHLIHRHPVEYHPQYWAMTFPLAMYTTGTLQLSKALNFPPIGLIAKGFIFIAALVWCLTMFGAIKRALYRLHQILS